MPTYEYRCKTCGHRFEHMQSISSDPLSHCPERECIQEDDEKKGTGLVERLISRGAGLVFKGEGFYLTDYARKGKGGSESTGSSGKGSSGKDSESKASGSKESGGNESSGKESSGSKESSGGNSTSKDSGSSESKSSDGAPAAGE